MDERSGDPAGTTPETLDEFVAGLDDSPAYVPRGYEVTDAPDDGDGDAASARRDPSGDGDGDAEGADALDAVLDRLDREERAVVVVAGESGAGRSRLLAEVGRALRDRDGETVRYVRGWDEGDPPTLDGRTVLCLDDAGRLSDPDRFLRLAAGSDAPVRVVAAVRPVHAGTLDAGVVPDDVPRYELALDPLDEAGTADLLAAGDIPPDRAPEVHRVAGGNPFLSRRIASGAADGDVDADADPADAVADAVEALVPDGALPVEAGVARSLLLTVAALGTCDPDAATDADGDLPFDDPDDAREALDALADVGLLVPVERSGATAFAVRDGVVAEYFRYRALVAEPSVYEGLVDRRLATDGPGIARGLVGLRGSPLVRVGAVDAADAAGRVRPLLEDVAAGVVDADAPPADVLRVQALVGLVAPGALPHADLESWWAAAEPTAAEAGHLYRLAAVLYRHASATATDEYDLPVPPSTLFAHARTWLDRLNALAIDRPEDAGLQRRLARALRAAAASEAAAGRFDGAGTCLDRLDVLADDNPDSDEVRLSLATALGDTAGAAGAAGRLDDLGSHVDRLSALAADYPDHEAVRSTLATALVNAANYEGDAGRFGALDSRIDRLAGLAADHPGSDELQRRLAQGLLNATSAEAAAGRFGDADARLDRLAALAADNPEQEDLRRRLAQALLRVVDSETDAGRVETLPGRIDRLAALADDHPDEGGVGVPATGGCLIALRGLVAAGRYEAAAEAVETLGTLAERPGGFAVGAKGADVGELATGTGERLLRDGRLDLFERFAAVLAAGLSDGRWRSVSSDLIMTADSLIGDGAISMDDYRRVVECCD